jgi:hypothetical protein
MQLFKVQTIEELIGFQHTTDPQIASIASFTI